MQNCGDQNCRDCYPTDSFFQAVNRPVVLLLPQSGLRRMTTIARPTRRVGLPKPAMPQKPSPEKQWAWSYDGRGGNVTATTRSEAKAKVKRELGIRKSRLPAAASVDRVAERQCN